MLLASNISRMLTEMGKDEVAGNAAWGVSVEIEKYENKLRGLRDFLFDAERKVAH